MQAARRCKSDIDQAPAFATGAGTSSTSCREVESAVSWSFCGQGHGKRGPRDQGIRGRPWYMRQSGRLSCHLDDVGASGTRRGLLRLKFLKQLKAF